MSQEQRAAEIQKTQSETTMYSQLIGDESFRCDMPPVEGRCQSGTNGPSGRYIAITVGQFMQLETGSTILQEPLQYELQEFRYYYHAFRTFLISDDISSPQGMILPEEDPVDEEIVPNDEDMFAEFLNDLGHPDNSTSSN
jgi:hypothetical protein